MSASVKTPKGLLLPNTAKLIDEASARSVNATAYEHFAKNLSANLKDPAMRSFLKEEANKRFDGDYDILYSKVKDKTVGAAKFNDHLTKRGNGSAIAEAAKNERLNISVPLHIDKWDVSKEILVAVAVGAKERETPTLKAYDSNGNVYSIDANKEPNLPVLVIGLNERMNYQLVKSYNSKSPKSRISGDMESVRYVKMYRVRDLSESWYRGDPEIKFMGMIADDNATNQRKAFENWDFPTLQEAEAGRNVYRTLFNWHFDTSQGPEYALTIWEIDDFGSDLSLPITITTKSGTKIQVTLQYTAYDTKMHEQIIHYLSPSPYYLLGGYGDFTCHSGN